MQYDGFLATLPLAEWMRIHILPNASPFLLCASRSDPRRQKLARLKSLVRAHFADLVDQRAQRFGEPCVVERCATISVGHPAVSFEDSRNQCFAWLADVRHAIQFKPQRRDPRTSR